MEIVLVSPEEVSKIEPSPEDVVVSFVYNVGSHLIFVLRFGGDWIGIF